MKAVVPLTLLCLLAACGRGGDEPVEPQRFSLDAARHVPEEPLLSPDTAGASWTVSSNGQAIDFGAPGRAAWLTLACGLREAPATITVIRHAAARPGQKALFPVLGNGIAARFKVDAALAEGEWRWEGALPASDPSLDVFTGPRELEATLPGGGTLVIAGSRIPGEFVNWCRAGGRVQRAEAAEQAEADDPSGARPTR
ncbi:MAG TPA: hypothetical protein VEB68_00915 [Croceibacterium sp.]|nr:hypothetical protein [Croceibacterium sp.]